MIRGLPYPSSGGSDFIVCCLLSVVQDRWICPISSPILQFVGNANVRFGSLADLWTNSS